MLHAVLFLVIVLFEALSLYNSILHKQKEEELKKEISRLKKEISRLQISLKKIPDTKQLQDEVTIFSEAVDKKIQEVDRLTEQTSQEMQKARMETKQKLKNFDTYLSALKEKLKEKQNVLDMDLNYMNKRIGLYQAEQDDFKNLLIQCETQKSELENAVRTARDDISACYYDIQEKLERLYDSVPESGQKEMKKNNGIRTRKITLKAKPDTEILNLLDMIDSMSQRLTKKETGIRFEKIMCIILKANGFTSVETTIPSNDDGIDIFAERNHLSFAIQCKCYLNDVDKKAIQEVASGNLKYQKDKAAAVTNRHFNSYARQLAQEVDVELWEREQLIRMLCRLSPEEIAKCATICAKPEYRTAKSAKISGKS